MLQYLLIQTKASHITSTTLNSSFFVAFNTYISREIIFCFDFALPIQDLEVWTNILKIVCQILLLEWTYYPFFGTSQP